MLRASAWWIFLMLMPSAARSQTIPAARCTTLTGTAVTLPGDLRGRAGVLVIGFSRDSQEPVRGWSRRLAVDFRDSTTINFYEMAMLGGVPRLLRGLVVRAMKKDVPERAQGRFLTVTEDEAAWRKVARFDKADDAYVLVIDASGAVRWQGAGPPTDAAYAELKRHLP